MSYQEAIKYLATVELHASDGDVVMRIGYVSNLFFEHGEAQDKRIALAEIAADFDGMFGNKLTRYQELEGRRLKPIRPGYLERWRELARSLEPEKTFVVGAVGGGKEVFLDPIFLRGVGFRNSEDDEASFLEANFPIDYPPSDNPEAYISITKHWCSLLKPSHGTFGLALQFPENKGGGSGFAISAAVYIKRFPGFDFIDSLGYIVACKANFRNRIRGINWLTVLNDALVESFGGIDALRAKLGDLCVIHPYDGGIVIQAGPTPETGDFNRGVVPAAYRQVYHAIGGSLFRDYPVGIFMTRNQEDMAEATQAWLSRFE